MRSCRFCSRRLPEENMQGLVTPPKEQQEQGSLPPQDQFKEILAAITRLADTMEAFMQQMLTTLVPTSTRALQVEITPKAQIPFAANGPRSESKKRKMLEPSAKEKITMGFNVQCWKCKKGHYPKQCPQLKSKCYFCGNPDHKVQNCPKKASTVCFICTKTGHFANKCPKTLKECYLCGYPTRQAKQSHKEATVICHMCQKTDRYKHKHLKEQYPLADQFSSSGRNHPPTKENENQPDAPNTTLHIMEEKEEVPKDTNNEVQEATSPTHHEDISSS